MGWKSVSVSILQLNKFAQLHQGVGADQVLGFVGFGWQRWLRWAFPTRLPCPSYIVAGDSLRLCCVCWRSTHAWSGVQQAAYQVWSQLAVHGM